jgi:two-component system OmpR family response regulator
MRNKTLSTVANPAKTNILLVEDEGEICLLLTLALQEDNINIEHVSSMRTALAFLQKKHPSVVLLDNRLPDGFGFDLISYIKANCPSTKVIMMSGVDKAAGDFALETGADAFLAKPFKKSALLASIRSVLA